MSRISNLFRGAVGLGAMVAMAACGDADGKLLLPVNPPGGALMSSYVALGNSITAGWQSDGINDSTQRASYAFLLAQQAGTRFAYPSFTRSVSVTGLGTVAVGCPSLTANWVTQKKTDSLIPGGIPGGCSLRDASKATDVLNNVAVPFAYASDFLVTGSGVKIPVAPHTFILGGMAQVTRALKAEPTFVSIWIGNNETLAPATVGMTTGAPSLGAPALVQGNEFSTAFNAAVDSLVRARPGLQGILIGAVKVANAPRFWSADSLIGPNAAARLTAIGTFTGKGAPAVVGCGSPGVTGWLVSTELIKQIRSGGFPANAIVCNPAAAGSGGAGDIFVLDPSEQTALNAATDAYNLAISAKATQLGWAYLDPNPILAGLRTGTSPAIPAFPNFTSNTRDAATAPFGALFSLDGVHPSAAGQKLIANAVIAAINAKYTLQIPLVP